MYNVTTVFFVETGRRGRLWIQRCGYTVTTHLCQHCYATGASNSCGLHQHSYIDQSYKQVVDQHLTLKYTHS